MELIVNYLYLLALVEVILVLIITIITSFDAISPGFITVFMFLISTLCVIRNEDYWDVYFYPETFYVVSLGLLVVVVVEFLVKQYYGSKKDVWIDQVEFSYSKPITVWQGTRGVVILASLFLTAIYVISVIRVSGTGDLFSAIGVVHVNDELSVGTIAKICVRISRILPFPCLFILMYNMCLCKQKLRKNLWLGIPIVCGGITVFVSGVRSTFLYYIIAGLFYAFILSRFKYGWKSINILRYWKQILVFCILFLAIFVGSRSIVKNHEFTTTGIEYVTFYLGSPLHLFNKTINDLSSVYRTDIPGAYLLTWLYQELDGFGIIDVDIQSVAFTAVGGDWYGGGNVYTFFSVPLKEFGFVGMLVFTAVFYVFFDCIYYKKFRYTHYIGKSIPTLLIYGAYYYYVFMTFYAPMIRQFKLQTILEMLILYVIYLFMKKVRICIK